MDNGASHNFISRKLVSKLDLPTNSFSGLYIRLGDGHRIWVQERLGEFSCKFSTLIFELGNLDMVLGIDWIKTFEDATHNWKNQYTRFLQGDHWVELQASSSPKDSSVALKVWSNKQPRGLSGHIWESLRKGGQFHSLNTI